MTLARIVTGLILFGGTIIIGASSGPWTGLCDGEPFWAMSVDGVLYLPMTCVPFDGNRCHLGLLPAERCTGGPCGV